MSPQDHHNFVQLLNSVATRHWSGIILHHSLTEDGDIRDIDAIKKYHMSWRIDGTCVTKDVFTVRKVNKQGTLFEEPDRDIAYNLVIERVNKSIFWEIGRPFDMDGAHTHGYNTTHLGICVIGSYDTKGPDEKLWDFTLEVCRVLMQKFEFDKYNILGHRETYPLLHQPVKKSCPGWAWDMNKFREDISMAPPCPPDNGMAPA